jgi:hypothetical protein
MSVVPSSPSPDPIRIAMWSGPRNLSTALMRSFGSRPDTAVSDEPFYAHYLKATGIDHPGREEILSAHESDAAAVARGLIGPVPGGRRVWYQKHMSHHLLPGMEDLVPGWIEGLTHAFLVRDPARVIVSFAKVVANPTPEDLGLPQQLRLLERLRQRGLHPPIVDAAEIRRDPRTTLSRLCGSLGIPFDEAMLAWPAGPRETDGVWAKHWYASVERSTGFEPPEAGEPPAVPASLRGVLSECRAIHAAIRSA